MTITEYNNPCTLVEYHVEMHVTDSYPFTIHRKIVAVEDDEGG